MNTLDEINGSDEFDYFNYVITHQVVMEKLVNLIEQVPHKNFVNNNCSINYTCSRMADSADNQTYELEHNGMTVYIETPDLDNVIDHTYSNALILFSFFTDDKLKRYINYTPYDLFKIIEEDDTIHTLLDRLTTKVFNWQVVEFNEETNQVVTNTDIFDSLLDHGYEHDVVNKGDNFFDHLIDD